MTDSTSAVDLHLDAPLEVPRWQPLVAWLLAFPHYVVLVVLGIGAFIAAVIGFFAVLFTKQVPPGIHTFIVQVQRYANRVTAYVSFLAPGYPAFGLAGDDNDPGDAPMRFSVQHADELIRWGPLYKWILAIPHFIVLYALGIAEGVCVLIGFFAVLFTGRWPEGLRSFVVGVLRWQQRVYAYLLLRDEYPAFAFN
jgi:hypothetical protein